MAAVVRSQLQERALKAEALLQQIRPCFNKLREAAAAKMCRAEMDRLAKENAALKQQVQAMVLKLKQAEQMNGVVQVDCSKVPSSASTASPSSSSKPDTAAANTTEKAAAPPAATENKKQEKKVKPKKEPKKAASSADDSAPVDVSRLLLKVGKIVEVKKHPDADSLYVETVDLAEDRPRTIISGLVKHVPIEQMQDRLAVFACNLKPAKMRGILSEGMIMCASTPEKVQIVDVPPGAAPGDVVTFTEYPGKPDAQLNPKKKIWEALMPDMKTNDSGVATYKGCPFTIDGKGVCQAPGCPNFPLK